MSFSLGALLQLLRRLHASLAPATWSLIVAFCILVVVSNVPLDPEHPQVARCAAITLVMSYLWMSAPIPIGCTALLPLPLFPILGISPAKSVAVSYFNDTMWVFIGSFIVALAVEKSDLHRRIALRSLTIVGTRPIMVLAAFMFVTASLSMVLSNTACAIMMVPIAGAMFDAIDKITGKSDLGLKKALYLGIAYASSTGGLTTLTGTGPNLIMAGQLITMYPKAPPISYTQWFLFAGPIGFVMLLCEWLLLYFSWVHPWAWRQQQQQLQLQQQQQQQIGEKRLGEGDDDDLADATCGRVELGLLSQHRSHASDDDVEERDLEQHQRGDSAAPAAQAAAIRALYDEMGPISRTQKAMVASQGMMLLMWLTRDFNGKPGWSALLPNPSYASDGTVAIMFAILLFIVRPQGSPIMDWDSIAKFPWDICFLLGGGFAISLGFKDSGLSVWIADRMQGITDLPPVAIVTLLCAGTAAFTEFNSNVASASILLPLVGRLALTSGQNPLLFMMPVTLATSFAFCLPIATAPNAIAFGTGCMTVSDMIKVGLGANLLGLGVLVMFTVFLGSSTFDMFSGVPTWALGAGS